MGEKVKYVALLVIFLQINLFAQEQNRYSQYMYNKYEFNPAFAGLEGTLNIYGQIRNQWSNFNLHPTSYLLNVDLPVYTLKGAIGVKVEKDVIGFLDDHRASLSYNYINSSSIGLFSAGLGLGYRMLNIDGSKLRTPDGIYGQVIDHKDPLLFDQSYSGDGMIWDMGIVYLNKYIETGVSISNFKFNTLKNELYTSFSNTDLQIFFQYNLILSKGLIIKPMALLITDLNTTRLDVSTVIDYYGRIFAGFSVQTNNKKEIPALSITTGTRLNQNFKVYYSYDIDFSRLKTLHDGTHEIVLNYNLNKIIGKNKGLPVIYSPRNL